MKPIKSLTSACRYCRHFQPEGRRGGMCQKLGAQVQASWKACSLALPAFAPPWETLEDAWSLPVATHILPVSHSLDSDLENLAPAPAEETATCITKDAKSKAVLI